MGRSIIPMIGPKTTLVQLESKAERGHGRRGVSASDSYATGHMAVLGPPRLNRVNAPELAGIWRRNRQFAVNWYEFVIGDLKIVISLLILCPEPVVSPKKVPPLPSSPTGSFYALILPK